MTTMSSGILGNSWAAIVLAFVAVLAIRAAYEYHRRNERD
jgi:hypothetical protein